MEVRVSFIPGRGRRQEGIAGTGEKKLRVEREQFSLSAIDPLTNRSLRAPADPEVQEARAPGPSGLRLRFPQERRGSDKERDRGEQYPTHDVSHERAQTKGEWNVSVKDQRKK